MALISSGIDKVRAFELPGGIWGDGSDVAVARTALVRWDSAWSDKFYQVYVNGRYAGSTIDIQQRQMIVHTPTSPETPVRIEIFAVEAGEAGSDLGGEVGLSDSRAGRVKVTFLRGQNLPVDSVAQVYFDNGSGEIDYDNPLGELPIRIWAAWQDKAGFGMSLFGEGDFGYDCAAAVGFGRGSFARGQFGLDADTIEWVSEPLRAGVYRFGVKVTDKAGNESSSETGQVTVIPAARAAEQVSISLFNKQTNQLVLSVS